MGDLHNETAPFPDNAFKVGRYLGPSNDNGVAMKAKMLIANSDVFD